MSVTTIPKAGIADDAIDNTKLDVSGNYDFSGTVNFTGTTTGVGVPSTPYFRARNEATQSLSNGTDTIIHFQHDVFDPQGTFNNSSSTVTLNGISTDPFSFAPNVSQSRSRGPTHAVLPAHVNHKKSFHVLLATCTNN